MESHIEPPPDQPLLRIYTFGALALRGRVEAATEGGAARYEPLNVEKLNRRGTNLAFALLKALLSQPQRSASRDQLLEWLSPEHPHSQAIKRLDDAASVLRCLLRPASGENLLEYRQNCYRLAPYPRIWVDADAFHWYMEQACRVARFGEDALPLWEQAYQLAARGLFLADDLYSEWSEPRRSDLSGSYKQCVHELARLYQERGVTMEAERILREHVARDPHDEDALRPLMELLGGQERYQEAMACYARTRAALAEDGYKPDPRTRDIVEYLRTKEITRSPRSTVMPVSAPRPAQPSHTADKLSFLLAANGLSATPFDVLHGLVEPEGMQDMPLISRRLLLKLGIAAFINRLAQLDRKHISAIEREELGRALGESIADGWKLFLTTSNDEVLAVACFQISLIRQSHSLLVPMTRPYLYAGAYGLAGITLHFQERQKEAIQALHNGYLGAVGTRNPWYIAQNLICQADTYQDQGMYVEAVQAIEEGLSGLGEIDEEHRRARGHLLSCWADVAMMMDQYILAQKKLDESAQYLDKTTLSEEFDHVCWLQVAGKVALMAGDYEQAVAYLEEALVATPHEWLVRYIGILTLLAIAYARMHEREKSLQIACQAMPAIGTMNAPMTNAHFLEYIRKDILQRFSSDSKIQAFLADVQQQLPQLASFLIRQE